MHVCIIMVHPPPFYKYPSDLFALHEHNRPSYLMTGLTVVLELVFWLPEHHLPLVTYLLFQSYMFII